MGKKFMSNQQFKKEHNAKPTRSLSLIIVYVTVEGRNQTLFTLSTFEKKKFEKQKFLL